jgi:hypothetical protein
VRERCDVARGDARAPLRPDELEAKFRDCLAFSESEWEPSDLLQRLLKLNSSARVADVLR